MSYRTTDTTTAREFLPLAGHPQPGTTETEMHMESRTSRSSAAETFAELLGHRRSTKAFGAGSIPSDIVRDLLRTAVGRTPTRRPYGSAYARYDVAVTVIAGQIDGIEPAAYLYDSTADELIVTNKGDHRPVLSRATYDAAWLETCPAALILTADVAAANKAFSDLGSDRGMQFCWFEAGLITQNVYLWAADKSLGTVFLGGLRTEATTAPEARALLPDSHTMLGILPIGHPVT